LFLQLLGFKNKKQKKLKNYYENKDGNRISSKKVFVKLSSSNIYINNAYEISFISHANRLSHPLLETNP